MKKVWMMIVTVVSLSSAGVFAQEQQGEIIDLAKQWGEIMSEQEAIQKNAASEKAQVVLEIKSCEAKLDAATDENEKAELKTELLSLHEKKNSLVLDQVRATKQVLDQGYGVLREMKTVVENEKNSSESLAEHDAKVKKVLSAAAFALKSDTLTEDQRAQVEDTVILLGQLNRVRKIQGQDTAEIARTLELFENTIVQLEVVEQLLQNQRRVLTVQAHRQLVASALRRLSEFNGGKGMENFAVDIASEVEADTQSISKTAPAYGKTTPSSRRNRSETAWAVINEYTN